MANQTNDFFPPGYSTPQTAGGDYTKFSKGETLIRILSKPIMFWQDWVNKQPVRTPYDFNTPPPKPQGDQKVKHAWAMIIYNYNTNRIEICEITQQTIKVAIENLNKNPKWGNPFAYDISITKTGEGLDTEYSVIANPKEPVTDQIKQAYKNKPINLSALMTNDNPFEKSNGVMYEKFSGLSRKEEPFEEEVKYTKEELQEMQQDEDLPF